MEKRELKETLELVKGIELVATKGIEISKDGIGPEDIGTAVEVLKEVNTLVEAVKGAGEIDDEIKDLDEAELIQLGTAVYGTYKKIKSAIKDVK